MKSDRRINVNGRLFTQALKSALGSTGALSRKDRTASKENLPLAKENVAPVIEMPEKSECIAPGFVNIKDIASVEIDSSLLTKALNPRPLVERNQYSSTTEPWNDNLKFPAVHTDANETKENPTNFGSSPSWITDPSDLHNWVENSCSAEFHKTLCMVPQNDMDVWIKKNRLNALQKLGSNTHDQYSAIQSNGNMFSEMEHNHPGCWDTSNVFPQKSGNTLSPESHGLKALPVQNGKYKYVSPGTHVEEKFVPKHVNKLKDQKFNQENVNVPSEEKAVYRKSDGRTELASVNKKNSSQKLPHQKNPQVEQCKSEGSSINCCATFHDKQSSENKRPAARSSQYSVNFLMNLETETGFYDSHCHLDFLFNRQKFRGTYSDFMSKNRDTFPKSYKGCVAVFCNPLMFAKEKQWQKHLNEANVWGAFGCHPKSAEDYNDKVEKDLEAALNHPKVKALGEIGLDYSEGFKNKKSIQKEVFRRQLKIAKRRKLPLVIHCRDADDDAIEIMHEILPDDTVFHLHCFTGNWEKARKWLREFPKIFIGLTNLVTFPSASPTHEVARRLPLDYLLLETDAPYFVPSKVPRSTRFSHPGMAIFVAARIAELKGIDVETVLRATSANTRCVYNIPRVNSPRMLA